MVSIQKYLKDAHKRFIQLPFNNYVKTITDNDIPEEHKLLDAIYDLQYFVENAEKCLREMRNKLNLEMQETGVLSFKTHKATASFSKAVPSCFITSEAEIAKKRPDLMTTPEPKPNKTEIAKLLRKGEQIAGATLSNGGPSVLRITAIKNKTNPYIKGVKENV